MLAASEIVEGWNGYFLHSIFKWWNIYNVGCTFFLQASMKETMMLLTWYCILYPITINQPQVEQYTVCSRILNSSWKMDVVHYQEDRTVRYGGKHAIKVKVAKWNVNFFACNVAKPI